MRTTENRIWPEVGTIGPVSLSAYAPGDRVTLVRDGVVQPGDYVIAHAARNGEWRLVDEFRCGVTAHPSDLRPRTHKGA